MTNNTVTPVMPAGMNGGLGNSDGWNDGAWWIYSRSGSGSRHVMRELEALYEDAATERERDAIRRRMDMMS